jgi:hypothetical protein
MIPIEKFAHIEHPILRRLLSYWLELTPTGGRLPDRDSLDPLNFPWALPYVWLVERQAGDAGDSIGTTKFRYVLAGEKINTVPGVSYARKTLAELFDDKLAAYLARKLNHVCATPAICHDAGRIYKYTEKSGQGERLMLPLAGDSGRAEYVFGCTIYTWDKVLTAPADVHEGYVTTFTELPPAHKT